MSQFKRGSQPDLCFISNADSRQTRVLVQTRITTRPAFYLKHVSQPYPHLTPNADLSQTRISSQARISARLAYHLKHEKSTISASQLKREPASSVFQQ